MFYLHVSTMFSLWLFVCILSVLRSCSGENRLMRAYSPGDIIIGGLFPVHLQTNRSRTPGVVSCSNYHIQTFLRTQAMIYAIREINQRVPRVLPNFTLGYDIYDTCGDVSFAIRATLQLLKNQSDPQSCLLPADIQSALPEPQTKVVIGETFSEVSIAVARIASLSSVAQISYASSSELLSRKNKFPTFLRTVPSDEFQTKGIAKLAGEFNWKTMFVVGSDDEYGKYGSDRIVDNFRKMGICIEFTVILPGDFDQNNSRTHTVLDKLLGNISNSSAEAIVMFTKGTNVEIIMEAAIKSKLNRTWIAGDSWSTSSHISALPDIGLAGQVFGFIFKRHEVPGFKDYVMSMFSGTTNPILEHHLTLYPLCSNLSEETRGNNCSLTDSQQGSKRCLDLRCLVPYIDQDKTYSVYLAVQVIVDGLRGLLKCDNQQCEHGGKFTASELLMEIQKVNCTVNTTHIFFDDNGDPSLGYDIVYWNMSEPKQGTQIQTIGEYWPDGTIKVPELLSKNMKAVMVTAYNCSKSCKPGQELKMLGRKCCAFCVPCASGEFSPGNGMACKRCGVRQHSFDEPRQMCVNYTEEFLQWSDAFSIVLNCMGLLGVIVTIVFIILFTINRSTPVVKAVGGYLSFLEFFSLLVSFSLTFSVQGKPTEYSCFVALPVFGIAFSLCISCILANLIQILVGFNFNLKVGSWIKKLNRPMAVVTIVSGIQVGLSVSWLTVSPPVPHEEILGRTILHQCKMNSLGFFIAMITYNALLALICFLLALKGKQLPDLYKNAVLITLTMLLFFIIWIVFIPIYLTLKGKYKPAIKSVAILISSYSILGCHLAPKCYIMVFRKELNNENAITEYIKKHYEQKGMALVTS